MKFLINILKAFLINFCFIGIIFANISCPAITPKMAKDSPSHQVEAIISDVICSFRDFHSQNNGTFSNTLNLTKRKILPFIDLEYTTQLALGKHWNQLVSKDMKIFERDVKNLLIQEYVPYLSGSLDWEKINVSVNNDFIQSDNIAKVDVFISIENENLGALVTLKLIRKDRWRIFDLNIQSISIVDILKIGYDSKIKRNGLKNLLQILLKKS